MRREGYELQVSKPKAIMKEIDGVLCEPYEEVTIEAPDDCIGAVIESLGYRRGVLETMDSRDGYNSIKRFIWIYDKLLNNDKRIWNYLSLIY